MKKTLQLFIILLLGASFTALFGQVEGDYRSAPSGFGGSGNWNTASDWEVYTTDGGTQTIQWEAVPTSNSTYTTPPNSSTTNVTIQANHTMTLDTNPSVQNLTIEANGELRNTTSTTRGMYIYGNLTVNGKFGDAGDNIAVAYTGTTAATISGTGTIDLLYIAKFDNSIQTVTMNSGIIKLYKSTDAIYNTGTGTFTFGMNGGELYIVNGTLGSTNMSYSFSGGEVYYSSSAKAAQTIASATYNNLTLSGAGTKTLGGNATVNGTLSLRGTASFALGGFTLTWGAASTLEYAGSSAQTFGADEWTATPVSVTINNPNGVAANGSKTITGTLTVNAGSDFNNGTYTFTAANIANNGTISGTGLITLGGALSGSGTFENLAVSGASSNTGTPTINQTFSILSGATFDNSTGTMIFVDGVGIYNAGGTWSAANAGTRTYGGTVDVTYQATSTTGAELPAAASNALNNLTIDAATTLGASATANGTVTLNNTLAVGSGTTLTIKNPFAGALANLTCAGHLYVDGTAKATIYLPAISYGEVTIDRAGGVYLSGATTITKLNFTNGNLYTGSYTLTVDPTQLSGEADGSYIVGTVKTPSADTPAYNAYANLGLTIGSAGTITGTGIVFTRTTGSGASVTVSGNSGFDRVYELTGTGMAHSSTVTCAWFGSESTGRNLSNVAIWEFTDGTGSWTSMGPDGDGTGYSATSTTASSISGATTIKYTITDDANPLPVELTSFTASVDERTVTLEWETATEVDNYGFEIERNLVQENKEANWETLGFVQGSGNSNSPKQYSYVDESVFFGKYQYRLKQIDTDGKFEYFDVIEVQVGTVPEEYSLRQNYPNPFNPSTVIEFGLPESADVTLSVYNLLGEKVATLFSGNMDAGFHKVDFNANNLSSGIYIYSLEGQNVRITKKMMLMK